MAKQMALRPSLLNKEPMGPLPSLTQCPLLGLAGTGTPPLCTPGLVEGIGFLCCSPSSCSPSLTPNSQF